MKNHYPPVTLSFIVISSFFSKINKTISRWFLLSILSFLFSINTIVAQVNVEWNFNYGGSQTDRFHSIIQTSDGGFIGAAYSRSSDGDASNSQGFFDFWIVKMDSDGLLVWEKSYGGSFRDEPKVIRETVDGGYIIIGGTSSIDGDVISASNGNWDYWVVKLNAQGELEWENTFGGAGEFDVDFAYDVALTSDNSFVIVGQSNASTGDVGGNNGEEDIWVVKINEIGELVWEKNFGGSDVESVARIHELANGNLLVGGTTSSNDGDVSDQKGVSDFWILQLTASGELVWEKTFGGTDQDFLFDLQPTTDGGFVAAGGTKSNDLDVTTATGGFQSPWIVKFNSNAEIEWDKTVGFSNSNFFNKLILTDNGKYVLFDHQRVIWQLNEQGEEEWSWENDIIPFNELYYYDIIQTDDDNIIVVGSKRVATFPSLEVDALIIKLKVNQTTTPCPGNISGFTSIGEYDGHEYFLSEGTSGAPAAQDVADANGGYLAVINSQAENDFIQQNISEMVYIGLNDFDSEGNLVWVNGDPFDFDNINPCGFCNENSAEQDFLIIQPWDGAWSFSNIFNQRKYLIEVPCNSGQTPECGMWTKGYTELYLETYECTFENPDGYESIYFTEKGYADSTRYIKTGFKWDFDGAWLDGAQEGMITIEKDLNIKFINHSKKNPWVYVYDEDTEKIMAWDYNSVELFAIDLPAGTLPPPFLRMTDFDDKILITGNYPFGNSFRSYSALSDFNGNLVTSSINSEQAKPLIYGEPYFDDFYHYYFSTYQEDDPNLNFAKINGQGDLMWSIPTTAVPMENDVFYIGTTNDQSQFFYLISQSEETKIYKANSNNGDLVWGKNLDQYIPTNFEMVFPFLESAAITSDNGVAISFQLKLINHNYQMKYFLKINENGGLVWADDPFGLSGFMVRGETSDGGILMSYALNISSNNDFIAIARATSEGQFEPLCNGGNLANLIISDFGGFVSGPDPDSSSNILTQGEITDFFRYRLQNDGAWGIHDDYNVRIYISSDETLDANDQLLLQNDFGVTSNIYNEWQYPILEIPTDLTPGHYRLIVVADEEDVIAEFTNDDNLVWTPFFEIIDDGITPSCPDDIPGFTSLGEFNDSKYFISNDVENPIPAQAIAESLDGYLVAIDSQEENDFIFSQISEMAYIGLTDFDVEGDLIWENGDPLNFSNFDICNFCNPNSEEMDFVVMHGWNGGWSWSNIFNQRKYIVEVPCTGTITAPPNTLIVLLPDVFKQKNKELILGKVYPNPSSDLIFTQIKNAEAGEIEFHIFDARGVLWKSQKANLIDGENLISISIANLPNGVYTIKIPNVVSKNSTQRFIKVQNGF